MKVPGFKTRKFPAWLQAFNLLCGVTALAIAGFGVWHVARGRAPGAEGVLVGRGEAASVDTAALADRLATGEGGSALGNALSSASETEALRVLDAAVASCLPGGLTLAATLAGRAAPVGPRAAAEASSMLGLDPAAPPATDDLRARVQLLVTSVKPRDVTLLLAARAIVQDSPYRRRAAVERLASLQDGRSIPALIAALGTPESERETRALAESALATFAGDSTLPRADDTAEDRWRFWWQEHESTYVKAPYDLLQNARLLGVRVDRGDESARRDALRGLGIVRERSAAPEMGRMVVSKDPLTRAIAAWALGRAGGPEAIEALTVALKDPEPAVRIAAARAVGRARLHPAKPDVAKLLDDPDASVRRGAALALLGFLDRQGLAEIDVVAFDAKLPPRERIAALEDLDEAGDGAAASSRWIAAISDPDEIVRVAARVALSKRVKATEVVVGRPAWERWWLDRYGGMGLKIPLGAGG